MSVIAAHTTENKMHTAQSACRQFSFSGPDIGVWHRWPDCWVSTEFFRVPIPRKGSGSTNTMILNHNLALRDFLID